MIWTIIITSVIVLAVVVIFMLSLKKYNGDVLKALINTWKVSAPSIKKILDLLFDKAENHPGERTLSYMKTFESQYFGGYYKESLEDLAKVIIDMAERPTNQLDISVVKEHLNEMKEREKIKNG